MTLSFYQSVVDRSRSESKLCAQVWLTDNQFTKDEIQVGGIEAATGNISNRVCTKFSKKESL